MSIISKLQNPTLWATPTHPPHPPPSFELLKIGSFKFPAPQGPKLRLNSPLKCRIFWSVTPLPKEKMFKWREKRHGLWPFGCKHNSNMFYDVKFYYTVVFSHWMQYLRMNCICFTFTPLFNSCSCILCGQQLSCENSNISAATYWIDYLSCKT